MSPAKILFLAANPVTTTALALDEEVRAIDVAMRVSAQREAFALVSKWATRADDLQQHLLELRPAIVHFSGHGSEGGGLVLHGEREVMQVVSPAALAGLFRVLRGEVRVVFFNSCHSLALAEAVAQEIACAIGMGAAVGDEAARIFAASFYRALGFGRSVGEAFELGRAALALAGIAEEQAPQLRTRAGVDAWAIHLARPAESMDARAAAGRRDAPGVEPTRGRSDAREVEQARGRSDARVVEPAGGGDARGVEAARGRIEGSVVEERRPRVALLAAADDTAWLRKLHTHLRPLARRGGFEVWDSSMVPAGARWREAVAAGLEGAHAVVVLVSAALLADEELADARLPELVARADAAAVRLLSLVVSACAFASTELDAYRPLNDPGEPLDAVPPAEQNRRLVAAAEQIAAALRGAG